MENNYFERIFTRLLINPYNMKEFLFEIEVLTYGIIIIVYIGIGRINRILDKTRNIYLREIYFFSSSFILYINL